MLFLKLLLKKRFLKTKNIQINIDQSTFLKTKNIILTPKKNIKPTFMILKN